MLLYVSNVAADAQPPLGKFAQPQPLPQAELWRPLVFGPLTVAIVAKGIKCIVSQIHTFHTSSVSAQQIGDVASVTSLPSALHSFAGVALRALQPNNRVFCPGTVKQDRLVERHRLLEGIRVSLLADSFFLGGCSHSDRLMRVSVDGSAFEVHVDS